MPFVLITIASTHYYSDKHFQTKSESEHFRGCLQFTCNSVSCTPKQKTEVITTLVIILQAYFFPSVAHFHQENYIPPLGA